MLHRILPLQYLLLALFLIQSVFSSPLPGKFYGFFLCIFVLVFAKAHFVRLYQIIPQRNIQSASNETVATAVMDALDQHIVSNVARRTRLCVLRDVIEVCNMRYI